mmetsp:Transcript_90954/g.136243  ORF Transcript_90954/g.136243 Transcript_90954/m.136243 type:complete len:273 (+) Transcript_90954:110-928(+)
MLMPLEIQGTTCSTSQNARARKNQAKKEIEASLEPGSGTMQCKTWTENQLNDVTVSHRPPKNIIDYLALYTIKTMRFNFDIISGYAIFPQTESTWLNRIIFLETVAGVPGSIAGTLRHLASLRRMKRDHGWIRTLLDEAENERMHLLTALELKNPGKMFRLAVMLSQGIFYNFFFVAYMVSPRFCHRLVGYLEEEAVTTYTKCLEEFKKGNLPVWEKTAAPVIAKNYWKLKDNATMLDVIRVIRADEANHRDVNHTLAGLDVDDVNPFSLKK